MVNAYSWLARYIAVAVVCALAGCDGGGGGGDGSGGGGGALNLTPAPNLIGLMANAHSSTYPVIQVCIENPARMSVAHLVPGTIADVDATRILFSEETSAGDALSIYMRTTGIAGRLSMPNRWARFDKSPAHLTPAGAIVVLRAHEDHVFLARLGTLTDVGRISYFASPSVRGGYAVWNDDRNLYRVDAAT